MIDMSWSTISEEVVSSLFSLVKKDGVWKSIKQREFLKKHSTNQEDAIGGQFARWLGCNVGEAQVAQAMKFIDADPEAFILEVSGRMKWADGKRGARIVSHLFVCDQHGIAMQFKLSFTYDSNGCARPNPNKATTAFERGEINIEHLEVELKERAAQAEAKRIRDAEQAAINATKQWVGEVGKRDKAPMECIVKVVGEYYPTDFGYSRRIVFETMQGDVLVWWSSASVQLEEGQKVNIVFTVKAHDEYKGTKQTVVSRVTLK